LGVPVVPEVRMVCRVRWISRVPGPDGGRPAAIPSMLGSPGPVTGMPVTPGGTAAANSRSCTSTRMPRAIITSATWPARKPGLRYTTFSPPRAAPTMAW
jgi:hypothetical protein